MFWTDSTNVFSGCFRRTGTVRLQWAWSGRGNSVSDNSKSAFLFPFITCYIYLLGRFSASINFNNFVLRNMWLNFAVSTPALPNLINRNLQMKIPSGCPTRAEERWAGRYSEFPTDKTENPLQRAIKSYVVSISHWIRLLAAISVRCSSGLFTRFILFLCCNKVKTPHYLLKTLLIDSFYNYLQHQKHRLPSQFGNPKTQMILRFHIITTHLILRMLMIND